VLVEAARLVDFAPAVELVGEMRAAQRATLAAEVSGKVVSIAHRVGEAHPSGKSLISIDPASYQVALSSSQAALDSAKQQLAEMQAGPRTESIAAQQAVVDSAAARLARSNEELARFQELFDKGYVSASEMSGVRAEAEAAAADHENELQQLKELQAGTRSETIAAQEARVAAR
jgi:HlyD family secretion protein